MWRKENSLSAESSLPLLHLLPQTKVRKKSLKVLLHTANLLRPLALLRSISGLPKNDSRNALPLSIFRFLPECPPAIFLCYYRQVAPMSFVRIAVCVRDFNLI